MEDLHMAANEHRVASSDIKDYVSALVEWVESFSSEYWTKYMITMMFELRSGPQPGVKEQIERSIALFYGTFLKQCMRYPLSKENREWRPHLIVCPDYPVYKQDKKLTPRYLPKGGLHYGGLLLVSYARESLCKTGVIEHFRLNDHRYCRHADTLLTRVHLTRVDETPGKAADYTFKALKTRRASFDDLLVFPMAVSE
jgi:hypothetical protein